MKIIKKSPKAISSVLILALMLFLPECAFAADLSTMVNKITSWISTGAKSIGTIIIICVGIYWWKNHERWKEVTLTCIAIIGATLLVMNAQSIANVFFTA